MTGKFLVGPFKSGEGFEEETDSGIPGSHVFFDISLFQFLTFMSNCPCCTIKLLRSTVQQSLLESDSSTADPKEDPRAA